MRTIYEPTGRALEYSPLALNDYDGCGEHKCAYCFAPGCLHKTKEEFYKPKPRAGIIEQVLKIAPKYKNGPRVLLCFTCDPYQKLEAELKLTQRIIQIFGENQVNYQVLTKSPLVERDLDLIQDTHGVLAMTFTSWTCDDNWKKWEPGVQHALFRSRVLKKAHTMGIPTWVSLEPVLFPAETVILVHNMHEFVDLWRFGKLNGHPHEKTINWGEYLSTVVWGLIKRYNLKYYIKNDLYAYNQSNNPQTNCEWWK